MRHIVAERVKGGAVEGNSSSPASPERRGGGTGAGWYIRHIAAKGIKEKRKKQSTKEYMINDKNTFVLCSSHCG